MLYFLQATPQEHSAVVFGFAAVFTERTNSDSADMETDAFQLFHGGSRGGLTVQLQTVHNFPDHDQFEQILYVVLYSMSAKV